MIAPPERQDRLTWVDWLMLIVITLGSARLAFFMASAAIAWIFGK